ncbi:MAG: helix-turn-helix domain-containing protein [Blastocatellia bacterium]|nr:helix-turn-helix domain-containing protein [Blastocatellia bacterium]
MMTPLSIEIKSFRNRLSLSQADLAALLGLPEPARGGRQTVSRWERGEQSPAPYLGLALREVERKIKSNAKS